MTRIAGDAGRFSFTCSGYTVEGTPSGLPLTYSDLKARAELAEEIALHERNLCCVTVRRRGESWPFLVVAQSFWPAGVGFEPGVLLVPETKTLFLGAGERILAYRLEPPAKLWEDAADTGFHRWEQHGDTILLTAELEFAAWDTAGRKLWSTFAEPPWEYSVNDDRVELDVMGNKQTFGLREGPLAATQ